MPSSTSSSEPLRRRDAARRAALRHGCVFLAVMAVLVGFDAALAGAHRRAEREAWTAAAGGDPAHPLREGHARRRSTFSGVLDRVDDGAVLFIGNSVVETTIVPPVLERELGLGDGVRVEVLALPGAATATVLRALELSRRVPAMAVVDLAPRILATADEAWARRAARVDGQIEVLDGEESAHPPESPGTGQSDWTARVEDKLVAMALPLLPRLTVRHGPSGYLRALADGLRHGISAYRCASFGNIVIASMEDGSVRTTLLNGTPGYARFREESIATSLSRIRAGKGTGDAAVDALLASSKALAARGCRVVLVDMPCDPRLRAVDGKINGERWADLARRVEALPGVSFVDLGADPRLAALPFYDGHHREYVVAREASVLLGELLRPLVPPSLR